MSLKQVTKVNSPLIAKAVCMKWDIVSFSPGSEAPGPVRNERSPRFGCTP